MGRRRPQWVFPLVAAALLGSGCVPRIKSDGQVPVGGGGLARMGGTFAMQRELTDAERRVRALELKLAERDREIATVRQQIDVARSAPAPQPEAAGGPPAEDADGVQVAPAAPAPAEPSAAPAVAESPPPPAQMPPPVAAPQRVGAAPDGGSGAPDGSSAPRGPAADQQLAAAERQVASLEQRLAVEVQRRKDVETEMARLLQETSSGPYEQADGAVEKHLRQELSIARDEITALRTTLASERRERQDLDQRYRALQAKVQANASDTARGGGSEEIEALKERQRRVLASIQQDLQVSKQREAELRQTVQDASGAGGVSLANEVTGLRSENSALQMRLDDEHRRNRDLAAKLQLATRVTDLIFKMQSTGGSEPAVAQPAADAR